MGSNKVIDVVYVLGKGSSWNNNEIRYSLRALEKNLLDYRNIWVVGEKPEWIKGIKHIPFGDELTNNADGNIIRKILRVCQENSLTQNFLFINDDHFIMQPIKAIDIPAYHKGNMAEFVQEYFEADFWRKRLWRTKNILIERGLPAFHYDCHVPIVINKKHFPEVMSQFNFEHNIGYTMKSLYANVVHGEFGTRLRGEKVTVFQSMTLGMVKTYCAGRQFVAVNNKGLKIGFKIWLYLNFPDVSSYEKSSDSEPFILILKWLSSEGKDYHEGCELFAKYGRSRKVKKFLSREESHMRLLKLEHQLRELLNYL